MEKGLLRAFWRCGDNEIIEFAMMRARLNRKEREVVVSLMDECMTQEETAEKMDLSTRHVQNIWYSATNKILSIPWVLAYAKELKDKEKGCN